MTTSNSAWRYCTGGRQASAAEMRIKKSHVENNDSKSFRVPVTILGGGCIDLVLREHR